MFAYQTLTGIRFQMTTIILIILALMAIIAFIVFQRSQHLKAKARECSKEAKRFHEKLQQLTEPNHFFTDEELHQLKREFAPLLKTVNKFYDSILILREYLDDLGLNDFLDERKLVNHRQYLNNIHHQPSKI